MVFFLSRIGTGNRRFWEGPDGDVAHFYMFHLQLAKPIANLTRGWILSIEDTQVSLSEPRAFVESKWEAHTNPKRQLDGS